MDEKMRQLDKKNIEDILVLTPMQEGMLFHYLKDPQGDHYFEQLSLVLSGDINVKVFEKAWDVVIKTNEMLRTVVRWEKLENPVQVVLKRHQTQPGYFDVSHKDEGEKEKFLHEIKIKERKENFGLQEVPFRVMLCKTGENRYEMIISHFHILYDGWSTGIILKEFFNAYTKLCEGKEPKKTIKSGFKEFVKWVQSRDSKEQETFWNKYLTGLDTQTGLSIKKGGNAKEITNQGTYQIKFEEAVKDECEAFVKTHRITLAALLYCAWGILLQKYNNSDDVVFGTTISGRSAKVDGIEEMVGLFINTLPLRVQIESGVKTRDLLKRIYNALHEREAYEHTSLVTIHKCMELEGNEQLFDTIVVIENYPLESRLMLEESPLTVDSYAMVESTHYDLTVGITIFNGIHVDFAYNGDGFEKESVIRLSGHFRKVLGEIVKNPDKEVALLELLSAEEKKQLLEEFNDTAADFPKDKTLHGVLEEQTARAPDHIAIAAPSTTHTTHTTHMIHMSDTTYMTYKELDEKSNQLAFLLIEKGVRVGRTQPIGIGGSAIVGIMMERSIERVIGIMGILKAGGAYLPIDPEYPEERIRYMLADSNARILVVDEGADVGVGANLVFARDPGDENSQLSIINETTRSELSQPATSPENLAYIIYTSGTTGRPKGVAVSHGALVNRLYWLKKQYGFNKTDVILQKEAFAFDGSVCELFRWILPGAVLCLLPAGEETDAAAITQTIERHKVTTVDFVPSMFKVFLDYMEINGREAVDRLHRLRRVLLGGEVLPPGLVAVFNNIFGDSKRSKAPPRLINTYGPTEATIDVSHFDCSRGTPISMIPIGKPMDNARLYILDRNDRLQPVGVPGELAISGVCLARGYLNNPELTREMFAGIHPSLDPFITQRTNASLFYRTNDLARWLTDGNIEFLGRIDQQVKVRGFRIELGEIEACLKEHKWVKEAVVIVREDEGGDKQLLAYIVAQELGQGVWSVKAEALREFLSGKLPEYMVPSYFVQLEKLPLTTSGKIDRIALPQPAAESFVDEAEYTPPRSHTELQLAETWSGVLGINEEVIGIDSNFFRLGGHSLKVTQLMARINKKFGVEIPLSLLFERVTIRAQAEHIDTLEQSRYLSIEPVSLQEYYDLSYAQRRLWIICQFEEDSIAYNQVGALTIRGTFNPAAFVLALRTMVERHESLRTLFITIDGEPKQKILETINPDPEEIDLRQLKGAEKKAKVSDILKTVANKAFDLEKGPLFVFKLLRLEEEEYFLIVNTHHIINDGWSVDNIRNELYTFYNFFNIKINITKDSGKVKELPLPPLKLQYRDYTLWHNRLIDEGYFSVFESYWLEKFKDKPTGIELPLDHPRKPVQTFNGGRVFYTIGEQETSKLRAMCPRMNVTLFMKLLAQLSIMLHKYSGETDIPVGSPIAGRKQAELHPLIGFLVNTLVYRIELDPQENFLQLLGKTRRETLNCYENQDYPFDILVERLGLDRDMSRSPLFNVMMAFNNAGTQDSELDVRMEGVEVTTLLQVEEFNPSVFDLVFIFNETRSLLDNEIMYNSDLFERGTIERMAANFLTLITNVVERVDEPIYALDYIHEKEYETIVHLFNDTGEAFPGLTIRELVENRVEQSLDKIAVVSPDGASLTYNELDKRANRMSHYLAAEYGVGPGQSVGICIDRSLEMIITILGVIKSGAGYLSIDPNYPQDRARHMMEDSRADIILIDRERPQLFGSSGGQQLVDINRDWERIGQQPHHTPEMRSKLSDIVYVIYTSGSTGMPNGAMLSHALLSNLVLWQAGHTSIDSSGRCLQFTSINFCVSFQEIITTLSSGGEVHLIGDIERQDVIFLEDFLKRRRIENLYLPFSYLNFLFNTIADTGEDESFRTYLRHIITAGEHLKITSGLKNFLDRHPWIKLHNHYGSSEMHVVTSYTLDASGAAAVPVPPAGKPVANTRIYILDEYEQPVPIGVWGELFVDGSSEVPGYIHNPVLTNKKLLRHPVFSPLTGHRLYRSGDVGRWLEDGNIELKGRKDFQVKIRGFRVEPSEIESKILSIDRVKDCVVVVKENASEEKRLVAYVVAPGINVMEIKRHLRNYLPQYMIPQFVTLESLPLMPNGKVDRDRLPEPPAGDERLPDIDPAEINALLLMEANEVPVEPTLKTMLVWFTRAVENRLFHSRIKISGVDVDILPDNEKKQSPSIDGEEARTIVQLFEEQVERVPAQRAIQCFSGDQGKSRPLAAEGKREQHPRPIGDEVSITYNELNEKSNRLASLLKKKGVACGSVVGLMCRDSVDSVFGALGIMKAGGGYLPISPDTPDHRITQMLSDNSASMLLTNSTDLVNHSFLRLALHDLRGPLLKRQTPIVTPPRPQVIDFDRLPIPDRSLVNYDRYGNDIGLAMVRNTIVLQATRGCPYNCLYCHKIWPKRHVVRSAENIFREVELYYRMGVRRFVFADDIFNLDVKNSTRFFELIIKNGLDVHLFFPNGLRSDLLTPGYIDLAVEAGTVGLGLALETASPRLQKLIRKHLNLDKLRANIEYISKKYPQVVLELFTMHGFPTETEDEALMTLEFIKNLKWVDFPYVHILKIYPNTDMAALAMEKGVSAEAIERSANLAYHELPETLPFDKSFTMKYQSDFTNDYFLLKERLLAKLPYQMKVLTPIEIVEKYNSYLPVEIRTFSDLLRFVGIEAEELGIVLDTDTDNDNDNEGHPLSGPYITDAEVRPNDLDAKIRAHFLPGEPDKDALRILLLDLSQFFSSQREALYDGVEPPLGLIYLLTYLNREYGSRVNGKIAKSRTDFDNYEELKGLIEAFEPAIIGIRTLSHHSDFFHKTVALVRQWGIDVPIIAGGPYATSDYGVILQDPNVDLVVKGEGELTFSELVGKIIANQGRLPDDEVLKEIPGLAFIPGEQASMFSSFRDILMLDGLDNALSEESVENPEAGPRSSETADIFYNYKNKGRQLKASCVFDGSAGSLQQLFGALVQGGSLCVFPRDTNADTYVDVEGVELLEFYKESAEGETCHIHLQLAEHSPLKRGKHFENETEEKLAEIWSDILGLEKNTIGRDHNFFELGGHSLKATTMMTRIHKEFNTRVKLVDIFKAPTIGEISAMLQDIHMERHIAIPRVKEKEYYVLSAAQKRMYVLQQMEGGISYNMYRVMILEGALDMDRLIETADQLIRRHEAFRTSFMIKDKEPVQVVHDPRNIKFEIEYHDLGMKKKKQEKVEGESDNVGLHHPSTQFIIGHFLHPFDLLQAPLLRVGLIKIEAEHHIMIVDMHHIISDGTSLDILTRDFMAFYAGDRLPVPRLRYRDYSEWQQGPEVKEALEQQEEYWVQAFGGEIPVLDLPLDYVRPKVQSFEGSTLDFEIEGTDARALKALALEEESTLYMVLLSIYTIFLSKLSRQEEIVVGSPTAGRRLPDLEQIIGMFVNTLALKNDPVGEKTFREFLREVKENTLSAFENQDYQYEELVKRVPVARDTGRNPLFDTMFIVQNVDMPELKIPGLTLKPYDYDNGISKFDLLLQCFETEEKLCFILEYCTSLFKEDTIRRFVEYFRKVASDVVECPDAKISGIEIISAEEKKQVLYDFNDTAADTPEDKTIHELFEEQTARTPDHIAIAAQSTIHMTQMIHMSYMTYKELNKKSNQLALLLREKGVTRDMVVGFMVERSIEMIIGILSIMKAGGAYLPLDTQLPKERKTYMLRDSNVKLLLTNDDKKIVKRYLPDDIEVIDPGEKNTYQMSGGESNPHYIKKTGGSNLVYVIYTSGSTGRPKGVMLEHRNLVNLIRHQYEYTSIDFSRVLQFTTLSFDVSFQEIFSTLLAGGQLTVVSKETVKDIPELFRVVDRNKLRTLFLPASFLKFVLNEEEFIGLIPGSVKHIVTAGEQAVINDHFRKYLKENRVCFHNHYGPSETHVVTTLTLKSEGDIPELPSIGKPILNTGIYMLDKWMNLLPMGVPGEIYICGSQVGRGYLNNSQLTNEKFDHDFQDYQDVKIKQKFCGGPGGGFLKEPPGRRRHKIYKTGDLARWLSDGTIEFLGRIDLQVKVRGYRIELGEIESRLLNHEEIKEAVVLAKERAGSDKYLCAYIIARSMEPGAWRVKADELREYLSQTLPDYMIPSYFVHLEKIPLTPSNKVDWKALPDPGIKEGEGYVAPRDQVEEKLVEIWSEVLGIDKNAIGIDSGFFELGGHSLGATVMVSKAHKALSVKLPLAEVFKTPTIRGLSGYIRRAKVEKYKSIEPVEKREYYRLSSAQERLYVLQQMDDTGIGYNMPFIVPLEQNITLKRLEQVFRQLIVRHENLRTSLHMIEGEPVQRIHDNVAFEIDYYDLAAKAGGICSLKEAKNLEEVEFKVGERENIHHSSFIDHHFVRAFDLSKAPLLRVGLIKVEEKHFILTIDMHHIITDGTSQDILTKEFNALLAGEKLSCLRLQYKDYSQWQNSEGQKDLIKQQELYWIKEFSDELPTLHLPTDYARPAMQSFEGNLTQFNLNAEETRILKNIAEENNVTLYMVLLAVFNILFSKLSGQEDIIIGMPVAARRHADLQFIVGMMVNTLAVRNFPSPGKTIKQFLEEVRQRTLRAYENQEYQFEDLVDKVSVRRDTSRNPIFDVMFNLLNQWGYTGEIPGAPDNVRYEHQKAPSRFDIAFNGVDLGETIFFAFEYSTKLFTPHTIERFISYLKKIIAVLSIPGSTDRPIAELEIMSEEEKNKVLGISEGVKETPGPGEAQTIHRLFENQVKQTPDNIALVYAGTNGRFIASETGTIAITYNELNERSNRLARLLREKGVGPNTVVGLMVERSPEMILSMLAIMKAGGAYLPLDPEYPPGRIDSMLADSGVSVLLTKTSLLDQFSITSLKDMKADQKKLVITPVQTQIKDFDSLPIPDRTLIDYRKYHQYIGEAPVKHSVTLQATRGCPYNCLYCHKIWPKKHVVRSAGNIFKEISYCFDAGVRRFVFVDDIFNLDKKNSRQLLEQIIKSDLDIQLFFPNGFRGDILEREFIDLLVEAGMVNIAVALESACPRIQKLIRKNLDLEKFKENVRYIAETYPHVILEMEMMHGFPTETEEEAMQTLDFLKELKWVHFPNLHLLKIFPNTDMYTLAIESGISKESIERSANRAFHQLSDTLPFPRSFTRQFQAKYMGEYFLLKERLKQVLHYQVKILTEDELIQKYDSYLPSKIKSFPDILRYTGISMEELGDVELKRDDYWEAPDFCEKMRKYFPIKETSDDAMRILLLDLSQFFSDVDEIFMHHQIEEPLGLLYLMTYLNERFKERIHGKVFKSGIDFDSYEKLKAIIADFKPDLIGIRTLSYYKDFFHKVLLCMRQWGVDVPIVAGGPYATSDYMLMLQDFNVDLAVLGEGEFILGNLVEKMLENHKKLPEEEVLQKIDGIAFIKKQDKLTLKRRREIILLEEMELARYHPGDLENINQPGDMVYVIYTSGSTGRPKGVLLEHRNLANLIKHQYKYTDIDFTRVLQFTTMSFDVSFQEIFSTLLAGGQLTVVSKETVQDIPELFRVVGRNKLRTLFLPASFLKFVLNEEEFIGLIPGSLKHIVTAGEQAIINDHFRRYLKENRVCFHNHYGPSETHVVTALTLDPEGDIPELPSIGRPILNTGIYILDKGMNLLPLGVPGELYIGGIQVGRGYLNNPQLTAENFGKDFQDYQNKEEKEKGIDKHPLTSLPLYPSTPLYRTGDLARWLSDGNIEFLGRIDLQVKIRGFRVELGEIESHLLNHKEIKEAVVLAKVEASGVKYLCAYIIARSTEHGAWSVKADELREYLSQTLPDYMVPSYFVQMEAIPLTPNGKINRKALPEPEIKTGEGHAAPRNPLEEKLTRIWSEVLGIGKEIISIDSDFFQLGGHSLKATVLVSKIHKELNVRTPLSVVFKRPDIRSLAQYIREARKDKYTSMEPVEKKEYYALSSAQKRMYIEQQLEKGGTRYNLPLALVLHGELEKEKLENIFRQLIRRHESFRTSIEIIEDGKDEPVQKVHDHVEFKIGEYDFAAEGGIHHSLDRFITHHFIRPFDLSRPPLLRVGVVKRTTENATILVVDMHHILTDAVSLDILIGDFKALYIGKRLPPLRIQYKDFAAWQNDRFRYEGIMEQKKYWLDRFSGDIPVLAMPTDFPRPPVQRFEGEILEFEIDEALTKEVKTIAEKNNATLYVVLSTICFILLSKYTGQTDIIVGTPTAGRRHADLDNIIGMFVNVLSMRNFPKPEKRFNEFLKEVNTNALDALENQDYPFDHLAEHLQLKRDKSRNPLFDVVFAVLDVKGHDMEIPGLKVEPYNVEHKKSKTDLRFAASETGDTIGMTLTYATSLFQRDTARQMAEHYLEILEQTAADTNVQLKDIKISHRLEIPKLPGMREKEKEIDFNF